MFAFFTLYKHYKDYLIEILLFLGYSIIILASKQGCSDVVESLLENGADVNSKDNDG